MFVMIVILSIAAIIIGSSNRDFGLMPSRLPWMAGIVGLILATHWMPRKLAFSLGWVLVVAAGVLSVVWTIGLDEHTHTAGMLMLLMVMRIFLWEARNEPSPAAKSPESPQTRT